MTSRIAALKLVGAGVVVGLLVGGAAYAVVVAPDNAGDKYYACVSSLGVVKSGTIKLNTPPTSCPSSTDVVHSWAAVGTTGPSGPTGATGPSALGPHTSTIPVTTNQFVVGGSSTGPVLGPVNTAECRSITVHWTASAGAVDLAYVYDVDPSSGDRSPGPPYSVGWGQGVGASGTTGSRSAHVSSGLLTTYNPSLYTVAGGFGDMLDLGGSVGPLTSVQLGASGNPGATVERVWLTCVPWT